MTAKIEITDPGGDYPYDLFASVGEYKFARDSEIKPRRKLALADSYPRSKARAETILKRCKIGSTVRFYLSPQDPEVSILVPGLWRPLIGRFVYGLLFLGAGLMMLLALGAWDR